jgi:septum site-determining protein MinC
MAEQSDSNTPTNSMLVQERANERKIEAVTIKGTANGLLIRLRDDSSVNFAELINELASRLKLGERFFLGARTSIDLGRREVAVTELQTLQQTLKKYNVRLEYVVALDKTTHYAAKEVGIEFKLPDNYNTRPSVPLISESEPEKEKPSEAANPNNTGQPFDSAEALFIRRTLRSGQFIHHHADVCLLGDVNPGAEIIAGGNVIVWGALRGTVHAGAIKTENGAQNNALVCALQLIPMQLNIGEVVTHAPENAGKVQTFGPEVAYLSNGQIIVESWLPGKKFLRGA